MHLEEVTSSILEDVKLWRGFKIIGWKPYFENKARSIEWIN